LWVIDLIESANMEMKMFLDIINRHGLAEKWEQFATRLDWRSNE